jgi:hypothetical protein
MARETRVRNHEEHKGKEIAGWIGLGLKRLHRVIW